VGETALELSRRLRKSVVSFAQPGQLFEDLGITYVGVVPGHNLHALQTTFRRALELKGPVIVHVRTRKGRGYRPAETDQVSFHGAALPPIVPPRATAQGNGNGSAAATAAAAGATSAAGATTATGATTIAGSDLLRAVAGAGGAVEGHPPASSGPGMPTESMADDAAPPSTHARKPPNYTAHFVKELVAIAREDPRVVAITAGMPTGTGLNVFQAEFPDRFFDVGICEPHAVTFATGLAMGGERPVVAIYSTFLQRAFDQQVHDVCQNDQPVLLAVDRAGLVGEDGTSHQGMFTLPAQRQLPNLVIASPKDEQELRSLVRTAFAQDHPFALHYPRDPGFEVPAIEPSALPVGRGELLREGDDLAIIGFGPIVMRGMAAAEALAAKGWSVAVINARFAKPLDRQLILDQARGRRLVVTLEESVVTGGFGSAVLELLEEARLVDPGFRETSLRMLGLPADRFVDHGSVGDLRAILRLDDAGIQAQIEETLATLRMAPREPAPTEQPAEH
jgi:deoxyxylulose-5-phosphate synthase